MDYSFLIIFFYWLIIFTVFSIYIIYLINYEKVKKNYYIYFWASYRMIGLEKEKRRGSMK